MRYRFPWFPGLQRAALACLILTAMASGFTQDSRFPEKKETLYVAPEAKPLREAVLRWAESLRSFNGQYTLRQRWPHRPEAADKPPRQYTITYRFDGDNAYMERETSIEPEGTQHFYLARYEGEVIGRFDYDYPDDAEEKYGSQYPGRVLQDHTYVRKNLPGSWPEPEGAFLPPPQIFQGGLWPNSTLAEFMRYGETRLRKTDAGTMLVHRRNPAGNDKMIFYFDSQQRVVRIEKGLGIAAPMEELEASFPENPLGLINLSTSLDLGGYKELNGVQFPTWTQKTLWKYPGTEKIDEYKRRFDQEEIDFFELQRLIIQGVGDPYEATVLDFDLISLAQPLNTPLSPSDFEVPIPSGAYVQHDPRVQEVEEYIPPWYTRLMKPVPLAVLAGLVLLIGGAAWYIARD